MHRRTLLTGTALAAAALTLGHLSGFSPAFTPTWAATQTPFTARALGVAQEAGRPILIAVHAGWCPVCTKQKPIISSLMQTPEFQDLVILTVDYDNQKDVLKTLGVTKQSTLIVMHGAAERGRSVGVTSEADIHALMAKARI